MRGVDSKMSWHWLDFVDLFLTFLLMGVGIYILVLIIKLIKVVIKALEIYIKNNQ